MGILTALVPWWGRWLAIAAVFAGAIGFGYARGLTHAHNADAVQIATLERSHAQELQAVAQAGAAAAQRAATLTAAQAAITQESDHDASAQRAALDARIAAGGLRYPTASTTAGCRAVPSLPGPPGPLHGDAGKPVPVDASGSAGAVQAAVADPVLVGAARDAQRKLELMDWLQTELQSNQ